GDWSAKVKEGKNGRQLWLTLRRDEENHHGNWSMDMPLGDFRGLDAGANGAVQFNLSREAGVITFEGLFKDGNGVGEFKFAPSGAFISAMRSLGYDNISIDKQFAMTLHDVTTGYVNELKGAGYDKVPLDKLTSMRMFRVDAEFIKAMRDVGYDKIPADKLLAMRVHNIDPEFVTKARAMGFEALTID